MVSEKNEDGFPMDVSTDQSLFLKAGWAKTYDEVAINPVKERRELHYGDRLFSIFLKISAASLIALLVLLGAFLAWRSVPAIVAFGWRFVVDSSWNPVTEVYGALPVIFGTLVSSFLAMLIAVPLSIGIALFLNELADKRVARIIGFLV